MLARRRENRARQTVRGVWEIDACISYRPKSSSTFPSHPSLPPHSGTLHDPIVIEFYVNDAVLGHRLDRHSLEIDGHSPLEFVGAHVQDLDPLSERNIWVMVLVEDGEAVVSMKHGSVYWGSSTAKGDP